MNTRIVWCSGPYCATYRYSDPQKTQMTFFRFDDEYDLILAYTNGKSGKMNESSVQRSVADFFDDNGLLCMDLVEAAVLQMHQKLAKKNN